MNVVYQGGSLRRAVPSLGVVADRDTPIEVDDAVGKQLVKLKDWNEAKPPKAKADNTKQGGNTNG